MVSKNGVDTRKFAGASSPEFKPALIYFGRFAANKGLKSLIASFAALKRRVPEASLRLVGNDFDGTLPALRSQIEKNIEDESVSIHTGQDDKDFRKIISECSFFVSASRYEGFGLSLVEAMSAGLIPHRQ